MKNLSKISLALLLLVNAHSSVVVASDASLIGIKTSSGENFLELKDAALARIESKLASLRTYIEADTSFKHDGRLANFNRLNATFVSLTAVKTIDQLQAFSRDVGGVYLPDVSASKFMQKIAELEANTDKQLAVYVPAAVEAVEAAAFSDSDGDSTTISGVAVCVDYSADIEALIKLLDGMKDEKRGSAWGAFLTTNEAFINRLAAAPAESLAGLKAFGAGYSLIAFSKIVGAREKAIHTALKKLLS